MILAIKDHVELDEVDVLMIKNLYNLSVENFIEILDNNVNDFTNIQELINSVVTSFVNFEKYVIEPGLNNTYKFKENEVVNLIDFVSATSFLVDKIVETKQCNQLLHKPIMNDKLIS